MRSVRENWPRKGPVTPECIARKEASPGRNTQKFLHEMQLFPGHGRYPQGKNTLPILRNIYE